MERKFSEADFDVSDILYKGDNDVGLFTEIVMMLPSTMRVRAATWGSIWMWVRL